MYGRGISASGNILDIGVEMKIVEKSGAWFSYKGERIGQGRENAKEYLETNPEIMAEIESRIRAKVSGADEQPLEIGLADPADLNLTNE